MIARPDPICPMKRLILILFGLLLMFYVPDIRARCDDSDECKILNDMQRVVSNSRIGAQQTLQKLYSSHRGWDCFLKRVGRADSFWLPLAIKLFAEADAGAREMLGLAFGEALANDPAYVLKTVSPVVDLRKICGTPDIDDDRFNSYEGAISEIDKRIRAVRQVGDVMTGRAREDCLQILEASKEHLVDFFERK